MMNAETSPPADEGCTRTILVVEDEEPIRVILQTALEMNGYRVLMAGDAEEAISLSSQYSGPLDLLITDMLLPGVKGSDLVRHILPQRPGLNVLYISGYLGADATLVSGPTGKMKYLPKPFTPAELLDVVRTLLPT
jgi:DNA-binding response OmpR family regulator